MKLAKRASKEVRLAETRELIKTFETALEGAQIELRSLPAFCARSVQIRKDMAEFRQHLAAVREWQERFEACPDGVIELADLDESEGANERGL